VHFFLPSYHFFSFLTSFKEGIIGKELKAGYVLTVADEFEYKDPFDHSVSSHQGIRFVFASGARFIVRLSGTGSSGATIRLYAESYRSLDLQSDHNKTNFSLFLSQQRFGQDQRT